jgi:hypothetical protein
MPTGWEVTSALATSAAAIFAGAQIWLSRADSQKQTTLTHLREIEARLQPLWNRDTERLQKDVLAYWRDSSQNPSDGVAEYLAFLNSLDLLGLAYEAGVVNKKLIHAHIRTLLRSPMLTLTFVKDLQQCCKDEHVYEHLERLFKNQLVNQSSRSA